MKILHIGAGLIITYLKNFIFDDDCIACQKHGKHGDKKILIDSVLCVLVLMGFELPFTDDGRGYHHNIHFLLMSKLACVSPMFILQSTNTTSLSTYIINIQYIPIYLYFLYAFFCPKNFY